MPRAWWLPEDEGCALYREAEDGVKRVAAFAVDPMTPAAVDVDADLLCWVDAGLLRVRHGAIAGHDAATTAVALPEGFVALALALRDEVVFVGGHSTIKRVGVFDREGSMEVLGAVDLHAAAPAFAELPVPALVRSHGKSIDAFVFDGDKLLALDDFEDPKWFLVYAVADPRAPRYLEARPLDPYSTGHRLHGAALAARHVVVVGTSFNHGVAFAQWLLFRRGTLAPRGRIFARAREQWQEIDPEGRQFAHVDAAGEQMLLSAGHEGLALADLRALDDGPAPVKRKLRRPKPGEREAREREAFEGRFEAALRWLRFPEHAAVRGYLIDPGRAIVALRDELGLHEVRVVALPAG